MDDQLQLAGNVRDQVRDEERAARQQQRRMQRLQARARTAAEKAFARRLIETAAELKHIHSRCRCQFRGIHNHRELRALNGGCTSDRPDNEPGHVCPRLDAVRRRMGAYDL